MKSDRRAKDLLRKTSTIKLPRTNVPSRRPLIAKPLYSLLALSLGDEASQVRHARTRSK